METKEWKRISYTLEEQPDKLNGKVLYILNARYENFEGETLDLESITLNQPPIPAEILTTIV